MKVRIMIGICLFFCCTVFSIVFAVQMGTITEDGVNIRLDSTIFSDAIGKLRKDTIVKIFDKNYEWYKVQLPEDFSCFVYRDFFKKIGPKSYICEAHNVNVRLHANLKSPVIGKIDKGEKVRIKGFSGKFLEIYPPEGITAWVHEKFVKISPESGVEFPQKNFSSKNLQESQQKEPSVIITTEGKVIIGKIRKEEGGFYLYTSDGRRFKVITMRNMEKFVGKKVQITLQKESREGKTLFVIKDIAKIR